MFHKAKIELISWIVLTTWCHCCFLFKHPFNPSMCKTPRRGNGQKDQLPPGTYNSSGLKGGSLHVCTGLDKKTGHICGFDRMPGQVQLLMESMPLIMAFAQKHNLQILPQASATDFGDSLCSQFQEAAGRHQRHCTSMFRAKVKLI